MILLDGKKIASDIKEEIALEVAYLKAQDKKAPHLAALIVGDNGASITYVNAKVKACERVDFESTLVRLPKQTTEKELLNEIAILNVDKDINGFIVQLPLPDHIDQQKILMAIDPTKDVDGFHPINVGKLVLSLPTFISATPFGILELLERYNIETSGKNVVVIGRSSIVGSPMSILLSQKRKTGNATVTLTHSRTKNLAELSKKADIVIAALGKPEFLKANMVKQGAVLIDVGISRVADTSKKNGYRLVGDIDFNAVKNKASYISPVPGGVGPMTIAMLLKNTLLAYYRQNA
ncbi:MAG: bifunctional methylenetetrahydrofolate dehydrogenase/methenyltetrahydrofolate cyclohydrolase FolD [Tenacibaculum sp.]